MSLSYINQKKRVKNIFGIKKTVTVLRAEDSAVKEAVNKNSNDNETEKTTM
jgi:hypothetical protein